MKMACVLALAVAATSAAIAGSVVVPVGTVTVAAVTTPFVAKNHFVLNIEPSADVRISYLGETFRMWFLEKVEESFPGSTLSYGNLSRESADEYIVAQLGGERKAATTLGELFSVLRSQKNGAGVPLLMNGFANVFYIRDTSASLRVVYAYWGDAGWRVKARSIANQDTWDERDRIFSREGSAR